MATVCFAAMQWESLAAQDFLGQLGYRGHGGVQALEAGVHLPAQAV
jgi:hypothetical protein